MTDHISTPDAVATSWVHRAPGRLQPMLQMMRADRPIGAWLLAIPCFWGLALAGVETGPSVQLILYGALMAIGAYVMRSAGCVYNDIVDQDIDAQIARTAARPLPSGRMSTRDAWLLLAGLLVIGLVVLLQFNRLTIFVGASALGLVAAYPFMKRITWWPQAWLGLTFNWGALVGYSAVTGQLSASAITLYIAGIFWTLGYDTIYAHQDREDDALVGVKSTARRLGEGSPIWVRGFYGVTIFLFAVAGVMTSASLMYFLALAPVAWRFWNQTQSLDIKDDHNCLSRFKMNQTNGILLAAALGMDIIFTQFWVA